MGNPKSIKVFGRSGREYRIFFNPQRGHWYMAYMDGLKRVRRTLSVTTRPAAEEKIKSWTRQRTSNELSRFEKADSVLFSVMNALLKMGLA